MSVALYMRAWIEVLASSRAVLKSKVALYMRAWIEVLTLSISLSLVDMSPST